MALEKPQLGIDVELGDDFPLFEFAAVLVDANDAVEHQHRRQGQQRVAGSEQLALAAVDEFVVVETMPVGKRN